MLGWLVGFLFIGFPTICALYMIWYKFIQWNLGTYIYVWDEGRFHKMRQCFGMDYYGENCWFDGANTIWMYKRGMWGRAFIIKDKDLLFKMRMWYRYGEDAEVILRNCGI